MQLFSTGKRDIVCHILPEILLPLGNVQYCPSSSSCSSSLFTTLNVMPIEGWMTLSSEDECKMYDLTEVVVWEKCGLEYFFTAEHKDK